MKLRKYTEALFATRYPVIVVATLSQALVKHSLCSDCLACRFDIKAKYSDHIPLMSMMPMTVKPSFLSL